jgi:hypothetical protein
MSSDSHFFRRSERLIGGYGADGCVELIPFDASSVDVPCFLNDLCSLNGSTIAAVVAMVMTRTGFSIQGG